MGPGKIPKRIQPILQESKSRLEALYGKRLKGIILYGSYARGQARKDSDIDLIVLLERMRDQMAELRKCGRELHALDFKYDTLISVIPLDAREFQSQNTPLILNARKEGIRP